MTSNPRIVRAWQPHAGRLRVAGAHGARARALATALLGTATGIAVGSAILVGAPVVVGASSTAGGRVEGPQAPSPAGVAPPVAAVIAPAWGGEQSTGPDRREATP